MTPFSSRRFEFTRWLIFLILVLSYILVYFHRMSPGTMADELMAAFDADGVTLGYLAATYFAVYAVMQIPSGVLADTLGTRTAIILGNTLAGVGSILFGMAPTFAMASCGRLLVGLGVSVVFVSIMKSNAMWFSERRYGIMSGLTLFVGNMGSVLAAGPLASLLDLFLWRTVFVTLGGGSLVLAGAGFLFVRNRPEDLGFPSIREMEGGRSMARRKQHWIRELMGVITVPRLWSGFWVQFGMIGGLYAFMGLWAIPYLRDMYYFDRVWAARYLSLMLVAFAVGSLVLGWLSDRMGRRKPILVCGTIVYTLVLGAMIAFPWSGPSMVYLYFFLLGFSGSSLVLTFACAKEVIDPHLSGMAVSVVNTGAFIGTSLMQPLFGFVLDTGWDGKLVNNARVYSLPDYQNALFMMLFFGIIGIMGALGTTETHCRNISNGDTRHPPVTPGWTKPLRGGKSKNSV
ncbi:MAG: MFS transporter [Desulfobacterium sp.]|nr:MFS transporter [Desulfobacterium sp.]